MANYRQFSGSPPSLGGSSTCPTCNVPYEYSDSPLVGYSSNFFSEDGISLYASSSESGISSNMPISIPNVPTPTAANPNTQINVCSPSYPSSSAYYTGDLILQNQQQSQGAIVVFIDMYKAAANVYGHALPVRFQTRTDYQDPNGWVDTPGLHGWVMNNNTTNQGFGGVWNSSVGGAGWRADGGFDTTAAGFGGPGTLQIHSTGQTAGTQNYLFAFEDVGDFRIITGQFQGADSQCQDGNTAMQNVQFGLSIDSLWDGTGTLYDYYVTTSPSGSTTNDTTKYYMAYESYGKFVKQFYEYDSEGELVPAPLSGAHYWKRLSGVVNPTIINPEDTNNGQYTGILNGGAAGAKVGYSTILLP